MELLTLIADKPDHRVEVMWQPPPVRLFAAVWRDPVRHRRLAVVMQGHPYSSPAKSIDMRAKQNSCGETWNGIIAAGR